MSIGVAALDPFCSARSGHDGKVGLHQTQLVEVVNPESDTSFAGEKSYLIRATLSEIEAELGAKQFLRISRSQIVNLERVSEIRILPNGRYRLVTEDGTELISSRRYAGRVREAFSL